MRGDDCVIIEYPFKNADLRVKLQAEVVLVAGGILNKSVDGCWFQAQPAATTIHPRWMKDNSLINNCTGSVVLQVM